MSVCTRSVGVTSAFSRSGHTDIEQDCAIFLLVDNMVFEDLVVKRSGSFDCGGHIEGVQEVSSHAKEGELDSMNAQ